MVLKNNCWKWYKSLVWHCSIYSWNQSKVFYKGRWEGGVAYSNLETFRVGSKTSTEGLVDIPFWLILKMTTAKVSKRQTLSRTVLFSGTTLTRTIMFQYSASLCRHDSWRRSPRNVPSGEEPGETAVFAGYWRRNSFFKLCREVGVRPKCSSSPGLAVTSCETSLNFITMEVPVVRLFQYLILQNLCTSDLLLGI